MKKTDEANEIQLVMGKEQGDAYVKAAGHMMNSVADDGGEKEAGDYIVAYAIEGAEGLYEMEDGDLKWNAYEDRNVHVEVSVRDAADNRFIPGLTVHATLLNSQQEEIGTHVHPMLWHPWLYHYGRNWQIDEPGDYVLRVRIEAPDFARHDKENGKRFAEPVEVEFSPVKITL
jgi:hypothetical protein